MGDFFGADIPFNDHVGMEPVEFGNGHARVRLRLQHHHMNSLGIAHGGVVMTLFDTVIGSAARSTRPDEGSFVTIDMQCQFLAPATGTIMGEGRVTRAGRSIIFAEGTIHNEETGELIAKATGTFRSTTRGGSPAKADG